MGSGEFGADLFDAGAGAGADGAEVVDGAGAVVDGGMAAVEPCADFGVAGVFDELVGEGHGDLTGFGDGDGSVAAVDLGDGDAGVFSDGEFDGANARGDFDGGVSGGARLEGSDEFEVARIGLEGGFHGGFRRVARVVREGWRLRRRYQFVPHP
jgi:hypothetical protein